MNLDDLRKRIDEIDEHVVKLLNERANVAIEVGSRKKTANAKFLRVALNGQVLHEDLGMLGLTPGGVDGDNSPFHIDLVEQLRDCGDFVRFRLGRQLAQAHAP